MTALPLRATSTNRNPSPTHIERDGAASTTAVDQKNGKGRLPYEKEGWPHRAGALKLLNLTQPIRGKIADGRDLHSNAAKPEAVCAAVLSFKCVIKPSC